MANYKRSGANKEHIKLDFRQHMKNRGDKITAFISNLETVKVFFKESGGRAYEVPGVWTKEHRTHTLEIYFSLKKEL